MKWNRTTLIDFFMENFQKAIIIKDLNSSFNIEGEINSIEELDLCSYSLYEIQIIQKLSKCELYITLHERFIGIHFEILYRQSKKQKFNSRKMIPYYGVSVSLKK